MSTGISMKESDLYPPLKRFLTEQGYTVKGEVINCDVVALRNEEAPLIVELKLNFNLSVLMQVVDRLALTPTVYIGIPLQTTVLRKKRKSVLKLLRMLGLGLVVIDVQAETVDVVLDPTAYKPRIVQRQQARLLGEFARRVGDPNVGGLAMRKGIMTAYRQRALLIGQYLRQHGASKAAVVALAVGDTQARAVLYRNVYGWFERVERGVYRVSAQGEKDIVAWRPEANSRPQALN